MSEYLNKIGLLKYNNTTYKPTGKTQYFSVRDPALVSSDPKTDYFNYPWQADNHWTYHNYGSGWYYNGRDEIAYTLNKSNEELSCINPTTLSTVINSGFVYNVIPIHSALLQAISATLLTSQYFNDLQQMFILSTTAGQIYKLKYDDDFRAFYHYDLIDDNNEVIATVSGFTFEVINQDNSTTPIVFNWSPPSTEISGNIHINEPPYVTGYWNEGKTVCGVIYSYPYFREGNINDIYSNELQFELESPNVESKDVNLYYYDPSLPATENNTNGFYIGYNLDLSPKQATMMYHPPDHNTEDVECLLWKDGDKVRVSWVENGRTHYYNPDLPASNPDFYIGYDLNLTPIQATMQFSPPDHALPNKECLLWEENNKTYVSYSIHDLSSNLTNGLFTNIPGTNYITGLCTTKMHFLDDQYVYMRGLVQGNIDIENGILQNEIVGTSTVIRKIKVKNLQGTLKNMSPLPEEMKYNLNHYYVWGWLYGVENIIYNNIWYKNEISGVLKSGREDDFSGILSTTITTNNGTEDIHNIISGLFVKINQSNIISGCMQGVIEPFSIKMEGTLTGYYNQVNNILRPLELSGILFNKSVIEKDLRQILDIKYYNTLGRKGLSEPYSLYGENLNFASKNYNPFDKPYMLETWKIIEYKTSEDQQLESDIYSKENIIDLNTYITNKKYIQQYKSKIHKSESEFDSLLARGSEQQIFKVFWMVNKETGDFSINCSTGTIPDSVGGENYISFNSIISAQKYIKHICGQSNLKLKDYIISQDNLTSYILDSSDLEIR